MGQKETLHLVQKASAGNKKAFERLCAEHGQSILYLCIKYMGNLHDGEDAAQEVFIKLQKKITSLKSPDAFTVWLQRLVYTTCNDIRRRDMKHNGMAQLDDYADMLPEKNMDCLPAEYLTNHEKSEELLGIINALPEMARSCVLLYYYEGIKTPEIASVLGITENAVNIQLYRARLKIRIAIEAQDSGAYAKSSALLPMAALGTLLRVDAANLAPVAAVSGCLGAAGIAAKFAAAGTAGAAAALGIGKATAISTSFIALATAACVWFYLGPLQVDSASSLSQPDANVPQHSVPIVPEEESPVAGTDLTAPAPAGVPDDGSPAEAEAGDTDEGTEGEPERVIVPGRPATPDTSTTHQPPSDGIILGQVYNTAGGGLPAGMEVLLTAPDGQTYLAAVSATGSFSFAGKASATTGTYTAVLQLPGGSGYIPVQASVSFEAGQDTTSISLSVAPDDAP